MENNSTDKTDNNHTTDDLVNESVKNKNTENKNVKNKNTKNDADELFQQRKKRPWLVLIVIVAILPLMVWLNKVPKNNINWQLDYNTAKTESMNVGKPLMILFTASWCPFCDKLARNVLTDANVEKLLNESFITLRIDLPESEPNPLQYQFNATVTPTIIFLSRHGREIDRIEGPQTTQDFLKIAKATLEDERRSNR